MSRKRYPKITKKADGYWHAWVTVGTKPNGRPDQRHISRPSLAAAEERVDELLEQKSRGAVVRPGKIPTVAAWLKVYLDTVAPRRCDPATVRDYWSKCRHWVIPVIGSTRLDQLAPDQLDDVYLRMARAGKASSTVLKTHRILTRALEVAYRRSLVPRNVAKMIDSPRLAAVEITPLDEPAALAILEEADGRRNSTRWSVALALGLRQGEALGLRWEYVDLDAGEIRVWWQLRRRQWEHGCEPACGRRRGGSCPDRWLQVRSGQHQLKGALILKEPKGKGKRTVPIPAELVAQLRTHQEVQSLERLMAGTAYEDHDLVFAGPLGQPVEPDRDYDEWKAITAAVGIHSARLHDGRHTAATLLLAQGVDIAVVQEILGHSDVRTTRGYTHVASELARKATDGIGSAILRKRTGTR